MTEPQHDSDVVADRRGTLNLGIFIGPLIPLGIGILLICLGAVVAEEWMATGVAALAVGAVFLGASIVGAHRYATFFLPEEAPPLALFVAVELLSGAALAFIGLSNTVLNVHNFPVSLLVVAVLGLALVSDSLILYQRGFKRGLRTKKGV